MSDPNRRGDWHLDKSVSFGHILTTVTILLSLAAGWIADRRGWLGTRAAVTPR